MKRFILYDFQKDGFDWTLLSVKNDFSKSPSQIIYGEYENQYGHVKKITQDEIELISV